MPDAAALEAHLTANRDRRMADYMAFLAIPSISALPTHNADSQHAANWLAGALTACGNGDHAEPSDANQAGAMSSLMTSPVPGMTAQPRMGKGANAPILACTGLDSPVQGAAKTGDGRSLPDLALGCLGGISPRGDRVARDAVSPPHDRTRIGHGACGECRAASVPDHPRLTTRQSGKGEVRGFCCPVPLEPRVDC